MTRKKHTLKIAILSLIIMSVLLGASTPFANAYSEGIRAGVSVTVGMPAEVIYRESTDAVIMLETFDINGDSIRTGSAFFITETGHAVTCLHVIDDAASVTITLYNGETYPLRGVHALSEELNLVIFSIDSDNEDWPYLELADSDLIETGNTVYVIGSPLEYINTMTSGIISHTHRVLDDETFIQFTAPISFGSGGSPLIDTYGRVVGVASSSFSYGQNLNLALPINPVKDMEIGELVSLESLLLNVH